jgi:hypothetical protein
MHDEDGDVISHYNSEGSCACSSSESDCDGIAGEPLWLDIVEDDLEIVEDITLVRAPFDMSGIWATAESDKLGLPPVAGCGIQRRMPTQHFQVRYAIFGSAGFSWPAAGSAEDIEVARRAAWAWAWARHADVVGEELAERTRHHQYHRLGLA